MGRPPVAADVWDGPPRWTHGDLAPGNLLLQDDVLTAVIDFGALGVGDPAIDLLPAWNLFDAEQRATFRRVLAVDEAMWERGKGWSLTTALLAWPYYLTTNPPLVLDSARKIRAVLTDP